jgi:hypothetical protein
LSSVVSQHAIVVTEHDASRETAQIYDVIRARFGIGFVPEVFQLLGSRPQYLQVLWDRYQSVCGSGVLARHVKELRGVCGMRTGAGAVRDLRERRVAAPRIRRGGGIRGV